LSAGKLQSEPDLSCNTLTDLDPINQLSLLIIDDLNCGLMNCIAESMIFLLEKHLS